MPGRKGDSTSSDAAPTGWRRLYEFSTSPVGVAILIAVLAGAIVALLIATISFDDHGSGAATSPPARYPPGGIARCSDGRDNDGDGKTDFGADPGCASPADITEKAATAACSDGRDNDGDGKTDFGADPGCSSPADIAEKEPACSDGRDNDGDGKIDFGPDPGCSSAADPAEKE